MTAEKLSIPQDRIFQNCDEGLEKTKPDIVILCPATGRHAEFVGKVAPFGVHILVGKPFAASLSDADRMIAALAGTGRWPDIRPTSRASA